MLQVPKLFGLLIFPALLVPAALLTSVMEMGRKTSSWLPGRFEKIRSSQAETLFVGLRILKDSEHHSDHWFITLNLQAVPVNQLRATYPIQRSDCLSSMIPVITINHHPSNPQQPIHSLRLAPVTYLSIKMTNNLHMSSTITGSPLQSHPSCARQPQAARKNVPSICFGKNRLFHKFVEKKPSKTHFKKNTSTLNTLTIIRLENSIRSYWSTGDYPPPCTAPGHSSCAAKASQGRFLG